ncbi:MAG: hypothetical protein DLM59_09555 [Pseudonocardiales bacterium]|nr:MAG: hypothetical protein DLM59_09555 [Pseudonocardiales bacterium]
MTGNRTLWMAAAGAALVGVALLLPSHPHAHHHAGVVPGHPAAAQSRAPAAPGARATSPVAPAGAAPTPTASMSPAAEPVRPAAEALWKPVATGFARDFATPGAGPSDWLARVRRWTTPYLADQYRQTDPHRIPSATLTSVTPVATGGTIVTFTAVYDTGLTLDCRVELGPTGWKVTAATPATKGAGQ